MKVCIIGCGFVGLATGVTIAHLGHRVRLIEKDDLKLASIEKGQAPFNEPDISSMLSKGLRNRRISASNDVIEAVKASSFIFIAVQTPPMKSGSPNLTFIKESAKEIGEGLSKGKIVIGKSTVLPGTTETVVAPILENVSGLRAGKDFGIAMNPEFLAEGTAMNDSLNPSRIVVGSTNRKTATEVMKLYEKIDAPKILTDIRTAEMIKYASNCFLATKISYTNEIANLCERFEVDIAEVIYAVGLDPRIGGQFLRAGLGFGGSCLPKDLSALISSAESIGYKPELLRAVRKINEKQPIRAVEMLEEELGDLRGKRIAILGLAFKASVDDIRDSKAFPIVVELLARGANVIGFDPLATAFFIQILPEISYASSAREALKGADGCIIQTEEKQFSKLGKEDFDLMNTKLVIDGRRIFSSAKLARFGVKYRAIGLGKRT